MSQYQDGLNQSELDYQQKLREAQEDAVGNILSDGLELINYIEVVENTSWFAREMRDKIIHPDSPKIACKAKCHWCCHQSVSVSAPEVFRITEFLKINKQEEKYISKLETLSAKTKGKSTKQRALVEMPCAFLAYGECQIYDVRPLFCQRQTSYSLSDCKKAKPKGFPVGSILSEKAHLVAYTGAIEGMYDGLSKVRRDTVISGLDLTEATLVALKNNTASNEWIEGENPFVGCELNT